MMTKNDSIVAIYPSHTAAEAAVKELQQSGFDMKKLSIVGRDYHTDEHVVGYPRLLHPQRQGHSHRVGWTNAREHGAVNASLLRQSCRLRIYRKVLSPGSDGLPGTDGRQRQSRQANG